MNKKVMAIAVAGALAVPSAAVLAQTSTVQIGGSITVFYYQHKANNPLVQPGGTNVTVAASTTDIMETSEPEMYIRGEEKLGGGMSVWFQCTSSMDAMVTGARSASGICARNSGIGLTGSFGNVFMGNWDTPEKLVFNRGRGWWGGTNSLTGGSAILLQNINASGAENPRQTISGVVSSVAGATTAQLSTAISNNPAAFFRRQAAAWNYHSPSWNGFSMQMAISDSKEQTGEGALSPLNQRLFSIAGQYSTGPFYVGLGYETHNDYNPGNVTITTAAGTSAYGGGTDKNWTLVAGYKFGTVFDLRGIYSKSDYDVSNTTGGINQDGWAVFADWAIQGPHTLRAGYIRADDSAGSSLPDAGFSKGPTRAGCGAASATSCATATGARVWQFAYSYAMSKRTELSLVYTKLDNDTNATYSLGKVAATAGNSQSSGGLVVRHRF